MESFLHTLGHLLILLVGFLLGNYCGVAKERMDIIQEFGEDENAEKLPRDE